jgi:hypothetical protein
MKCPPPKTLTRSYAKWSPDNNDPVVIVLFEYERAHWEPPLIVEGDFSGGARWITKLHKRMILAIVFK